MSRYARDRYSQVCMQASFLGDDQHFTRYHSTRLYVETWTETFDKAAQLRTFHVLLRMRQEIIFSGGVKTVCPLGGLTTTLSWSWTSQQIRKVQHLSDSGWKDMVLDAIRPHEDQLGELFHPGTQYLRQFG